MYFIGFGDIMILKMYSIVNSIVKNHSAVYRKSPYFAPHNGTLSIMTIKTDNSIRKRRIRSNDFPAGVSTPKIML